MRSVIGTVHALFRSAFRFAGPWRLIGETWLQVFAPRR